jgi:hypothetical protein
MIVHKALYGLKSSGFSWKKMIVQNLWDVGYRSTVADPDVFKRKAFKSNGSKYYKYMLAYVDDCLCVSHRPEEKMDVIGKIYDLKDRVGPPEQ